MVCCKKQYICYNIFVVISMKVDTVELKCMAVRDSQYPDDNKKEYLLVGRSNVGKSSFINTIVSRKNFAHSSSTPGKTQTLNFYLANNSFYLVDVPGYGYASINRDMQKKMGLHLWYLMHIELIKSRKNYIIVMLKVMVKVKQIK